MKSSNTKWLLIALSLALCSALFGGEPERVIVLKDTIDISQVTRLLAQGWTVKHQSAAEGTYGRTTLLFTLTPPPPEELAKIQERDRLAREEAWRKKREEFEKTKQVEKP